MVLPYLTGWVVMNIMKKLDVLLVCPNELPKKMTISNTLKAKQKLVGGLIEVFYLNGEEDVCFICNEEGKLNNLEPNRIIGNDIIYGNFIVIGDDYENADFKSLTKKQISKYKEYFNQDSIDKTNSRISARKLAQELFKRRLYGSNR